MLRLLWRCGKIEKNVYMAWLDALVRARPRKGNEKKRIHCFCPYSFATFRNHLLWLCRPDDMGSLEVGKLLNTLRFPIRTCIFFVFLLARYREQYELYRCSRLRTRRSPTRQWAKSRTQRSPVRGKTPPKLWGTCSAISSGVAKSSAERLRTHVL